MLALIDKGANVNAATEVCTRATPFHGPRAPHNQHYPTCLRACTQLGSTALIKASTNGHTEIVRALIAAGADVNAEEFEVFFSIRVAFNVMAPSRKSSGTSLIKASANGHLDVVRALVEAGADKSAKDSKGRTAADCAEERQRPRVFAVLDPEAAARKGEDLRKAFTDAKLVHVISTRFKKDTTLPKAYMMCDPVTSSRNIKIALEKASGVRVFEPNADNNAFFIGDRSESVAGTWLRNWREIGLKRAKETGGRVIQVVVPPGLSDMQRSEADMAADQGVPIVRLDCTAVELTANTADLKKMAGWMELTGLAQAVTDGKTLAVPAARTTSEAPTGGEEGRLREENEKLRAELARLMHGQGQDSALAC